MSWIRKNWFLISLIILLGIGFYFSRNLDSISDLGWFKWSVVSVTMFLMSWPLRFDHLKSSLTRPLAPLLACGINLVFIPMVTWPLSWFAGAELGPGLLIAAATPSTMASAAVLTRRAGGDDSVSILVTLLTNGTCFLVMPLWIKIQTGNQLDSVVLVATIYKLLFFVVLPIGLAQIIRFHSGLGKWASQNKPKLTIFALIGILIMVFLGAIKMGIRFQSQDIDFTLWQLTYVITVVAMVHLLAFGLGMQIARVMRIGPKSTVAIGFSGSQKTLMIGLSTAINLGFSIIPIVIYHSVQLILDSIIAEKMRGTGD
ncbi:MAG: bile acid:sodium symporter [Planctomycetota bacterium]